jgi:hypothetical protein
VEDISLATLLLFEPGVGELPKKRIIRHYQLDRNLSRQRPAYPVSGVPMFVDNDTLSVSDESPTPFSKFVPTICLGAVGDPVSISIQWLSTRDT